MGVEGLDRMNRDSLRKIIIGVAVIARVMECKVTRVANLIIIKAEVILIERVGVSKKEITIYNKSKNSIGMLSKTTIKRRNKLCNLRTKTLYCNRQCHPNNQLTLKFK